MEVFSGHIGILTSGGDTPGLNAAIRGLGKAASTDGSMQCIGFQDGFRGMMENRSIRLDNGMLSGILGYCDVPLVSTDFNGSPLSSVVDAGTTYTVDKPQNPLLQVETI